MFLADALRATPLHEWTWVFPPTGWTWPTVVTAIISVIALLLSIATFRQRVLYNPQPRIDFLWPETVEPGGGVPYLIVQMFNNGDAAARDIHYFADTMTKDSNVPKSKVIFEPGEQINLTVPIVMNTTVTTGLSLSLEGPKQTPWQVVRPEVTVTWRQPPFKKKNPSKARRQSPEVPGLQAYRELFAPKKKSGTA